MSRTTHRLVFALLATGAVAVPAAHAAPDPLCVPPIASAAPGWWIPNLGPAQKESRWAGALMRTLSEDTYETTLRAIWSPTEQTVYFELHVDGDPSLDPADDQVLLALGNKGGTAPELYIHVAPLQGCANPATCTGAGVAIDPAAVHYSKATTGISLTWSNLSTVNPDPRFTVSHPWVTVEDADGTYSWTLSFALRVPVTMGGAIQPNLRIYGSSVVYLPGVTSGTNVELPVMCTSSSLTSNDCLIDPGPGTDLPQGLPIGNMISSWSILRSDCQNNFTLVP